MRYIGDFNVIMNIDEKYGGSHFFNANGICFRNFLFEAGLIDLGFRDPAYIWTNRPHTSNVIHIRLDRVVVNATCYNL
jgi:hypothetical protein